MNMQFASIQSCHLGPEISSEQFIPEHVFLYIIKGSLTAYDGRKNYSLKPGDYCIARKNKLIRYAKKKQDDEFNKIVVVFDEDFLRNFIRKYSPVYPSRANDDAILFVQGKKIIKSFVTSLSLYYKDNEQIDTTFAEVKREELLLILLRLNPDLGNIFFNFGSPGKINLEEFMNRNFRFNISMERFAYLTGRSLSSFKRDFRRIFNETPGRWLIKKRLSEAYFLLNKENKKPSEIYLDLGFEDLSHFSFAFKKQYGLSPTGLVRTGG